MAGTSRNQYRVYPLTLAAGEGVHLAGVGSYFQCLAATAAFKIGMDDGPVHKIDAGFGWEGRNAETFETLRVENTSGAPNVIELAVGLGRFRDSRLSVSGTINANIVNTLVPVQQDQMHWTVEGPVVIPAASSKVLFTPDGFDLGLSISNTHPVYDVFLIASATDSRGILIGPHSSRFLGAAKWSSSAFFQSYNANAGPVTVNIARLRPAP